MPRPSAAFSRPVRAPSGLGRGTGTDILGTVRTALDSGDVMLAYQPVVDTATGRAAFHEGLIRIVDRRGQILPAGLFMDMVERLTLGRDIDCAALRCGLDTLARHPDLRLSVNLSVLTIGHGPWMDTLEEGIARNQTVAERLIVEITEGAAMRSPIRVRNFMEDLQDRGISFAMDDFGAGQTSLRHLRDLPFDILKIDGGFVSGCDTDPGNRVILRALVDIARQFDMLTVAEAVETEGESRFLASIGIDCWQGYHHGRPETMPSWAIPAGDRGAWPASRAAG
ncbi:MAG: EAL domain-containing protein [Jannaschia sp.]